MAKLGGKCYSFFYQFDESDRKRERHRESERARDSFVTMRRIKSEMGKSKTHFQSTNQFTQTYAAQWNCLVVVYLIIMMMIVIIELIAVPKAVKRTRRLREREREAKIMKCFFFVLPRFGSNFYCWTSSCRNKRQFDMKKCQVTRHNEILAVRIYSDFIFDETKNYRILYGLIYLIGRCVFHFFARPFFHDRVFGNR